MKNLKPCVISKLHRPRLITKRPLCSGAEKAPSSRSRFFCLKENSIKPDVTVSENQKNPNRKVFEGLEGSLQGRSGVFGDL